MPLVNLSTSLTSVGAYKIFSTTDFVNTYHSNLIFSSSSQDGARPKVEYSTDSTYKSVASGPSGIPHTSYSHTGPSYSTENPYKNRVSSFSYNI